MKRILISGATGNIGVEVIRSLTELEDDFEIIAGVRNVEKAKKQLIEYPQVSFRSFDFEQFDSFSSAVSGIDILFLLRPPQLSDVDMYFRPLLECAKKSDVEYIVFLSVQGVETSKIIPHNKIERLIVGLGFQYVFLRPSYFMQNLTTTLLPELVHHKRITLPSGKAKFNWIDIKNIGDVAAHVLGNIEKYQGASLDVTGDENKSFGEVSQLLSEVLNEEVTYISMNPLHFYLKKRREGVSSDYALVMTMLHFLPRFQKEPKISQNVIHLTGAKPTTLKEFIEREKERFTFRHSSHKNV